LDELLVLITFPPRRPFAIAVLLTVADAFLFRAGFCFRELLLSWQYAKGFVSGFLLLKSACDVSVELVGESSTGILYHSFIVPARHILEAYSAVWTTLMATAGYFAKIMEYSGETTKIFLILLLTSLQDLI